VDSDDWALLRMVELRQAGEAARFRVCWMQRGHRRYYWLEIRRENGAIERCPDPEGAVTLPPRALEGVVEEAESRRAEPEPVLNRECNLCMRFGVPCGRGDCPV
jgi:hypothetical protein